MHPANRVSCLAYSDYVTCPLDAASGGSSRDPRPPRCPLGRRCESCGAEHRDLAVEVLTTGAGEWCLTLCPRCAGADVDPPVTVGTAARLVDQHRRHS